VSEVDPRLVAATREQLSRRPAGEVVAELGELGRVALRIA
jgi:hypothetical protein